MLFALIITMKYTSCASELPPKCIILLEICDDYRKLRWFHSRPWIARGMFAPRVARMAAVVARHGIAYASRRAFAALGGGADRRIKLRHGTPTWSRPGIGSITKVWRWAASTIFVAVESLEDLLEMARKSSN